MNNHHDVIIIGAGLSGLYTAWRLSQKNIDVCLLEARSRIGGRIHCELPDIAKVNHSFKSRIDLGPAWYWPEFQPRLSALIDELGVEHFKQFTKGDLLYEVSPEKLQRHPGPSSHLHSSRIQGGALSLIEALQQQLPDNIIHTSTRVEKISKSPFAIYAVENEKEIIYTAEKIILAIPPRLANQSIEFEPALDSATKQLWNDTPTWMASHSKKVFIYKKPFWREHGLSGEVFSHHGPLSEIYDGSPADESFYALTAFIGIDAAQRQQLSDKEINQACLHQLTRLFGNETPQPEQILGSDWSKQMETSTSLDLQGTPHHPEYPPQQPRQLWQQKIYLTGTEYARQHGGYLEGAIESADDILSLSDVI